MTPDHLKLLAPINIMSSLAEIKALLTGAGLLDKYKEQSAKLHGEMLALAGEKHVVDTRIRILNAMCERKNTITLRYPSLAQDKERTEIMARTLETFRLEGYTVGGDSISW